MPPAYENLNPQASEIVEFWRNAGRARWFAKDAAFDAQIRRRYQRLHHAAARGDHDDWAASPPGALALVLLFDQVPRNLWRGSAHAFATDPLARRAAAAAIAAGHDGAFETALRAFFYLPFAHSEDAADQARSLELNEALARRSGDPGDARWASEHAAIVARFGRFPHRNACLGRETTPLEQAFLDGGGFAG
jgi:uncharacterized protein (DUF924 family)